MSKAPILKVAIAPLKGNEKITLIEAFLRKHGPLGIATPPEDIIRKERNVRAARIRHG